MNTYGKSNEERKALDEMDVRLDAWIATEEAKEAATTKRYFEDIDEKELECPICDGCHHASLHESYPGTTW